MPLQDTLDTYRYIITEADKLSLSYFTLLRAVSKLDAVFDGMFCVLDVPWKPLNLAQQANRA